MLNSFKDNYPFVDKKNFILPKDKKISMFGSGLIAKKTIDFFKNQKFDVIFDNSENLWDQKFKDLIIQNPKTINNEYFIIITSSSYKEISDQLIKIKFQPYKDFIISPVLNDTKIINELENVKRSLIFSSGSPPSEDPKFGGGVYKLDIDGFKWNCTKVVSGNCYGILKKDNKFFVVDEQNGILEINNKLEIENKYAIDKNLRPHGISFHKKTDTFIINSTEQDAILFYDLKFKLRQKIELSNKKTNTGLRHHHINDNLVIDDSLFVSMFSFSGNYQKEVYDGVILEYNLLDLKESPKVLKNELWMPHNIKFFNKSLFILNSLPGELLGYNMQIIGKFPAFTRGLAHDGKYFFIGQSKNRNHSKYLGTSNNISIDAGIILFDENTKVSRFLQVDPRISEIHAIEIID